MYNVSTATIVQVQTAENYIIANDDATRCGNFTCNVSSSLKLTCYRVTWVYVYYDNAVVARVVQPSEYCIILLL